MINEEIENRHHQYNLKVDDWVMMSDIKEGQSQLKRRDLQKFGTYLPHLDPANMSQGNTARNRAYIKAATFQNVTSRTISGMMGEILRKEPVLELPAQLDTLIEDANGEGLNLNQLTRYVLGETLYKSRIGLLAEFPSIEGELTLAEMEQNGVRPFIKSYVAESILDWGTERKGAYSRLSKVLLSEGENKRRILRLTDEGYIQEIWIKRDDNQEWQLEATVLPLGGDGQPLDYIPFFFCGSENNSPDCDPVLLADLGHVNIGQYRNNADAEHNSYASSHMQTWVTGLTGQWVEDEWGGELQIGGSNPVTSLPPDSQVITTQARETSTAQKLAETKREEMVELGARIIEPRAGNKTATQAEMESASETSILSTIAKNVGNCIAVTLKACCDFVNADPEQVIFELNAVFGYHKLTPQERQQLILEWQSGVIGKSVVRMQLRNDGVIPSDMTDDELDAEVQNSQSFE